MAVVLTTMADIFILTSLTSLGQGQPRFPAAVVYWELRGRVSALSSSVAQTHGAAVPLPFNRAYPSSQRPRLSCIPGNMGSGARPLLPCNLELPEAKVLPWNSLGNTEMFYNGF